MPSPHIIDIRWRIAAEEKAARRPPLAMRGTPEWYARRHEGKWCIVVHIPNTDQAYVEPVTQAEFDEVNARYRDDF
jgi:hypothetical protein